MLSKSNKVKASDDTDKWVVGRGNGEKTVHSTTSTVIRELTHFTTTLLLMALLFMTVALLFPTDGSSILLVQGEVRPQ